MEDALNAGHWVEFARETQLWAKVSEIAVDRTVREHRICFDFRFLRLCRRVLVIAASFPIARLTEGNVRSSIRASVTKSCCKFFLM